MFTSPNDGSNVNAAEFADNIRRVVYSFLERNSQAPTEEKTENPQNQSTNNQSADNQSTNNSSEKTFPNSTEMDVENEPQENENRNRDGRTENDWTFLGQNLEDTIRREGNVTQDHKNLNLIRFSLIQILKFLKLYRNF